MSNPLPSTEQYGAQTVVKPLTTASKRNPLPFAVQNGAQTVKAVDERKNEQSAAIG